MVNLLLVASANGGNGSSSLSDFEGSNPSVHTIFNLGTERHCMKKALVLVVMLATTNVFAYSEDPHQQFDMTHNEVNETKISFIQAPVDVTKTCDEESRRRGFNGMPYNVDACSFYNGSKSECTIVTGRTTNFHTIGHEVRHCLQGHWHK